MVSELIGLFKLLLDRLSSARTRKEDSAHRLFTEVIKPSFDALEKIHTDYQHSLSQLADHLRSRRLPPYELIAWFREAGMTYRTQRDFLWTIGDELRELRYGALQALVGKPELEASIRSFVTAIMAYGTTATAFREVSFYRSYEDVLGSVLAHVSSPTNAPMSDEQLAKLFYETDYVIDLNGILIELGDQTLPAKWLDVARAFRRVRAMLVYPSAK